MKYFCIAFILFFMQTPFKKSQLQHERVKIAYDEKEAIVKKYFTDKGLNAAGFNLFLRGFKKEGKLEVWIQEKGGQQYSLLHTYDFCALSGTLGPKRKEGDLQVPEGVYEINHFNPISNFYLSLGLNYPNASDKILSDKKNPGSAIYIHGNCVTIGCIPITDEKIKELYVLAVEARNNGQQSIPIHIFPDRLEEGVVNQLAQIYQVSDATASFWKNLQRIYVDFQTTKHVRTIKVDASGSYYLL